MATDYAVAPGEYLAEWLEDEGLTQQQVADRLGWSRKRVNEVVGGRAPIGADAAIELGRVTPISAAAWTRFESLYRADLARLHDSAKLEESAGIVTPHLASYLRRLGVTTATARNKAKLVSDLLTFHRCGTVDVYRDVVADHFQGEFQLAALKESAKEVDVDLLAAWLRAGELTEAFEGARDAAYDEGALRARLPELRLRAASPDETLMDDLADMLRGVGVLLQRVEPPASFPLHGVTRWIDGRVPLIQQTGRQGKDGFIIWTLFHEIGHVLNDPRGESHVEYTTEKKRNSAAERAANAFALETLFGDAGLAPFEGLQRDGDIARVAREIGISPGLAVFQLHRRRLLPYAWGNGLCVEVPA